MKTTPSPTSTARDAGQISYIVSSSGLVHVEPLARLADAIALARRTPSVFPASVIRIGIDPRTGGERRTTIWTEAR